MKINYQIILLGIVCLTAIIMTLILTGKDSTGAISSLVALISLAIGIMVPSPKKIDNRRGVLVW